MARRKKNGRRATGIQSKKGMLYIVTSQKVIKNGERTTEKKWIATGLPDTPENVKTASEMRLKLKSGKNYQPLDKDITIPVYVDAFLDRKRRMVSDTTYSAYYHKGMRIKEYFASVKVLELTTGDVEIFLDSLFMVNSYRPRTVKDIKVLFGSIMDMAIQDHLISVNPVKEAVINKVLSSKYTRDKDDGDDFFSYEEARRFLEIVEDHPLYELFYITLFFGLRREEVLGLRWSCINFAAKEFTVNHTVTKGLTVNRLNTTKTKSSSRSYPLNDEQIALFERLRQKERENRKLFGNQYIENDYIFKHEDGSLYYPDYPTKAFGKVIKANEDLPRYITFHGLRTSCVSILVHQGFDVKSIQKWVGHADIETTLKIYAKIKDKEAKQEILMGLNSIIRTKNHHTNDPEEEG